MNLLHIAVLALVQGVTAFLPVAPLAHDALLRAVLGWPALSAQAELGVHVGLLVAGTVYVYREVGSVLLGFAHLTMGRRTRQSRLAAYLVLATLPLVTAAVTVTLLGMNQIADGPRTIAWMLIGFGILLWLVDRVGMTLRRLDHLSGTSALMIGFAQVLALMPGVGRAGIAVLAGRMLGFERLDAARFAVLLGLPLLLGLAGYDVYQMIDGGGEAISADGVVAGALAFAGGLFTINAMMQWLDRATFTPFAVYRVLLGAAALAWLYFG